MSIINGTNMLNRQTICEVHARIMRNCFLEDPAVHVSPGDTRTTTGRSVFTIGGPATQFSPYHLVDEEVDLIAQAARVAFGPFSLGVSHFSSASVHLPSGYSRMAKYVCRLKLAPLHVSKLPPI